MWPNLSCLILLGRQEGVWPGAGRTGGVGAAVRCPGGRCARPPSPERSGAELSSSAASAAAGAAVAARGRGGAAALRAGPGNLALRSASGFFRDVRSLSFPRGKLPGGLAAERGPFRGGSTSAPAPPGSRGPGLLQPRSRAQELGRTQRAGGGHDSFLRGLLFPSPLYFFFLMFFIK